MSDSDLIYGLRRIKVETGSLVCLGCGHEHNCSTHGCALINAAIARLEVKKNTTLGGTYVNIEWFEKVEAKLKRYEKLAEEGRLIVAPCKIGDYVFDIEDGTPYKTKVLGFFYYGDRWACRTVSSFPNFRGFGTRIFLTLEEAEAALKKKRADNA